MRMKYTLLGVAGTLGLMLLCGATISNWHSVMNTAGAGSVFYAPAHQSVAALPIGSTDQFLQVASGQPTWATFAAGTDYYAPGGTDVAITDIAPGFEQLLYAALSASAAHTGATAAETTVAPATADGSATIAVAQMRAGAAFRWNVFVPATGDADGDETLEVNVYFGDQLVGTTGDVAVDGPIEFVLEGDVRIRAAGAAGTGAYTCRAFNGASTVAMDGATFSSFDTTATKAFTVKLDWAGTTDAADSATVQDATLYVANVD